jgi:hypothetical protein
MQERNGGGTEVMQERNGEGREVMQERNGEGREVMQERNGEGTEVMQQRNRESELILKNVMNFLGRKHAVVQGGERRVQGKYKGAYSIKSICNIIDDMASNKQF